MSLWNWVVEGFVEWFVEWVCGTPEKVKAPEFIPRPDATPNGFLCAVNTLPIGVSLLRDGWSRDRHIVENLDRLPRRSGGHVGVMQQHP